MDSKYLQVSRGDFGENWGLSDQLGLPFLITKKKKHFRGEEIPKRAAVEREAVSRIETFFNPPYGLVSTKSKALSMKQA